MRLKLQRLRSSSGMTIIEVLVAAAVFMLAFTLLVSISSTVMTRMAVPEKRLALLAANEQLRLAQLTRDTLSSVDTVSYGTLRFLVTREMVSAGEHRLMSISVRRPKSDRVLTTIQGVTIVGQ